MFLMGRASHWQLAGMAMDTPMLAGMALIVGGVAVAAYGLLPSAPTGEDSDIAVVPPDEAPLSRAHWALMAVLVIALVIDVMKPASLGFTIPGMKKEYGIGGPTASIVPFFALTGTVVGSILWGAIADRYGRKATILLSAVMFVGTSICGAMPSFAWNAGMCFMMGAAAGGMLPVTYALLAEMMPSRHRGWSLVLVGGLGSVGGYLAASGLSALLQPLFGWRILWLLNLPTGLLLVSLGALIPESARFLLAHGRQDEARAVMARFGAAVRRAVPRPPSDQPERLQPLRGGAFTGKLLALSLAAICYGLINFGLLLWLPAELVRRGASVALTSRLLAESALIAFPTIFAAAFFYSRWSAKWSVAASLGVTLLGLAGLFWLEADPRRSPVLPVALLIVGTNALIAMLLPYTAESFPLAIRGRTTGVVAACSKAGGLFAQLLAILALVPALGLVSLAVTLPTLFAVLLLARFGRETRGRELHDSPGLAAA
ncbi:MFS transporter [Sphingomonas ginkgonis]|uniref:MFS transporter n=2 Tax=Sphingomonas ginkgonis TaxID=2315330 RepID=A0A3R9WS92_9SPHN|nr:MFS transporter [Sphingomonas ginkgonis]